MKVHNLKTWHQYFDAVKSGVKKFEVRKNDRNFQIGDILALLRFDQNGGGVTGEIINMKITYLLPGGEFGIEPGFCVLGIEPY